MPDDRLLVSWLGLTAKLLRLRSDNMGLFARSSQSISPKTWGCRASIWRIRDVVNESLAGPSGRLTRRRQIPSVDQIGDDL